MSQNYGGFDQTETGGLTSQDFWPDFERENKHAKDYEERLVYRPFKSVVDAANSWIQNQSGLKLISAETMSLKYRGRKNLDLDGTFYNLCKGCGKNFYIHGLRIWYEAGGSSSSTNPILEVLSFAPTVSQITEKYPAYKTMSQEYERINREVSQYGSGKILNVQTVEIKKGCPHGFDGVIDTEQCSYKEHYFHKCIIQFTRVYLLKGDETPSLIGFKDFLPGKDGRFAITSTMPLNTCVDEANEWLMSSQYPGSKVIGAQVLENHFHGGEIGNSDHPFFEEVERISHTTIKYLRVHFYLDGEKSKPQQLHLVNLAPETVGGQGCCTRNTQKIQDHSRYIDRWTKISGARVLNVQTTFAPTNETVYGDILMRASSMGEWDWGGDRRGPMPMSLIYFQRLFILGAYREPTDEELPHRDLRTGCSACCTIL